MGRIPEFHLLAVILFSTLALASAQRRQYCAWRGCCPGRDDNCHTPFHDTLCYCDEFCQRTDSDCCPDYYGSLCHLTPAPPTLPTPTASGDGCDFEGKSYTLGETIEDNCNTCACQFVDGSLEFVCTTETCAIEMPRVKEINDEDPGWFARNYTDFWGKTVDRARRYYTGTKHPQHLVLRQYEVNIEDVENLPKSFDARDKWPGWIGGVQEQGACGSSWAVSTVAVSSDRLAIQSQGMFNKQLSAQHIISCHLQQSQGCDGGHTDSAYWFLRRRGVVTEECYPLMSGQSEETEMMKLPCRLGYKSSYPCPNRGVTSDLKQVPPAYRIASDANEIMYEIKENGPVQAHFLVKSDFFSYGGGVYRHMGDDSDLPGPDSYHSVRILGWGVDEFGTPYWLCANSWGRDWGEDGYFRIVRGENECEIESFVVAVWAQVDPYMMNTGDLRP